MEYQAVIGLEVHAELQTRTKMFCGCLQVDRTQVLPNSAVCPVCAGMPGALPVVNKQAVEYAIRVALALQCQIFHQSLFARKNYFYPDLPKGYQISQYEQPLARYGRLLIDTSQGEKEIHISRVHLEEDTGKLIHVKKDGEEYSLVDLNRAGVPLLEVVSEPDMHTVEEVRVYTAELRNILRYLGVNSGDMEKGVIRFEANVSIRPASSQVLGTRVEIKNLNSFRALERSMDYEIKRQVQELEKGRKIVQETVGWDDVNEVTISQRIKEEAHDYRYFPEPDLPPLVVDKDWIDRISGELPELPRSKSRRFQVQYGLSEQITSVLVREARVADYFEQCAAVAAGLPAQGIAFWITTELFAWMNQAGQSIDQIKVLPGQLASLLQLVNQGKINPTAARLIMIEMLSTGKSAQDVMVESGLQQNSDVDFIARMVQQVLSTNPNEVDAYLAGKETLFNWFFGEAVRSAHGKANPQVIKSELVRQLKLLRYS